MQNDVLKNNIAPWQEKGRWYHAHITKTGIDSDNTDQFLIDNLTVPLNSSYYILKAGYIPADYVVVVNNYSTSTNYGFPKNFSVQADGRMSIQILNLNNFTSIDFDLFIFIK